MGLMAFVFFCSGICRKCCKGNQLTRFCAFPLVRALLGSLWYLQMPYGFAYPLLRWALMVAELWCIFPFEKRHSDARQGRAKTVVSKTAAASTCPAVGYSAVGIVVTLPCDGAWLG